MAFFETEEDKNKRERQFYEDTLERYNVFEGIKCNVMLPEKQLKTSSRSGTTKGLATFAFGFLGYAAASGTSQNEENRQVETILQIVNNGIVFKNANMDGSDLRIPYGEIISMVVPQDDKKDVGIITLLQNKIIIIELNMANRALRIILNHISNILNERSYGIKNEVPGWGLDSEYEGNEISYDGSDISNLERISVMYEKGLLSEDEFNKLKKGIIEK